MKKIFVSMFAAFLVLLLAPLPVSAEYPSPTAVSSTNPAELEHILKELQEKVAALKIGNMQKPAGMHEDCAIESDLSLGEGGDAVHCLQKLLVKEGFLKVTAPTGFFGPMTREAVREWQEHQGIPATGYFGPRSREQWKQAQKEKSGVHMNENTMMHHALVEAPTPAPTLVLEVAQDAKDGFNVHVTTTNFTFAPEHASQAHVSGEGHLHIYVNGKKLGRMYGPWYHVSSSMNGLARGHHKIKVELSANDHSTYAVAGVGITAEKEVEIN